MHATGDDEPTHWPKNLAWLGQQPKISIQVSSGHSEEEVNETYDKDNKHVEF